MCMYPPATACIYLHPLVPVCTCFNLYVPLCRCTHLYMPATANISLHQAFLPCAHLYLSVTSVPARLPFPRVSRLPQTPFLCSPLKTKPLPFLSPRFLAAFHPPFCSALPVSRLACLRAISVSLSSACNYLFVYLFECLSVFLCFSTCLLVCLSVCLPISMYVCLSVDLSVSVTISFFRFVSCLFEPLLGKR